MKKMLIFIKRYIIGAIIGFAIVVTLIFAGKYIVKGIIRKNIQDVEAIKDLANDENVEVAAKELGEFAAKAKEKKNTFLKAFKKSYKETNDSIKAE